MAISISTVYSTALSQNFAASSTWTITGIDVPADATAAILCVMGGWMTSDSDRLDIANFDGDSDDHFSYIGTGLDATSARHNAGAYYIKYGETGFPTLGATGITLTGSFAELFKYGGSVVLFFLSGTVTDGTFVIGYDRSDAGDDNELWTSDDIGAVGASDMSFVIAAQYRDTPDTEPSGSGQTNLDTGVGDNGEHSIAYEVGEDVSETLGVYKYENCVGSSLASEAKCSFPSYVSKTDEERIQNIYGKVMEIYVGQSFTLTEKIDGTSLTVIRADEEFHVCSRNLSLKEPEDPMNPKGVYWQEAIRYDFQNKLPNNFAVQGEIAGLGVQSNRLKLDNRFLYIFYVYDIKSAKYLPIDEMESFCSDFGLKTVPVIDKEWILTPETTRDKLINFADGASLLNPQANREGVVWRLNNPDYKFSFKAISNKYLLKWGE